MDPRVDRFKCPYKLRRVEVEVRTEDDDVRAGGPPSVLGRYRIVAELGRGSTSIVYLGAIEGPGGFNKLFALKLLRPLLAQDPKLVAMFLTEARIGAQLNHPNVVSTLEIEEGGGRPFIVMEYLDGEPLQRVIAGARMAFMPLPLHMHLGALSGAVEGLGHAHAAIGPNGSPLHIVHRDVSPHNVFVTRSGMPKVLDFGFAQTIDSPNTMLSSAGRVAYMSPEQADGAPVDARSDLFAVGVMMWEAATRRRFWSEEASKAEILAALRSRELPSNRESALARCSDELRSLIVRATAADPADRYGTAAALQADLRLVLSRITPPTFALRDLGQRVSNLFAADRARLQRAMDAHREGANALGSDDTAERATPVQLQSTPRPPPPAPQALAAPSSQGNPAPGPFAPPAPPGHPAENAYPAPSSQPPPSPSAAFEATPPVARSSDPLPSFPIPSMEPARRTGMRPATLALAVVALAGAALIVLVGVAALAALRTKTVPTDSHAADNVPATRTQDNAPAAGSVAAQAEVHSAAAPPSPAAVMPSSATTRAAEPAAVEANASPLPRPRRFQPTTPPPHPTRAPTSGPAVSATDDNTNLDLDGRVDSSTHVSEVRPAPARAPHPIDSMNPYGP